MALKKEHDQCVLKFEEMAAKLSKQDESETVELENTKQKHGRSESVSYNKLFIRQKAYYSNSVN